MFRFPIQVRFRLQNARSGRRRRRRGRSTTRSHAASRGVVRQRQPHERIVPCQETTSGIISVYRRFCKGEKAFMLCRRFGALKLQKSGGRFTTSSRVPVLSDHKSFEVMPSTSCRPTAHDLEKAHLPLSQHSVILSEAFSAEPKDLRLFPQLLGTVVCYHSAHSHWTVLNGHDLSR
jgi:hypothetical protein